MAANPDLDRRHTPQTSFGVFVLPRCCDDAKRLVGDTPGQRPAEGRTSRQRELRWRFRTLRYFGSNSYVVLMSNGTKKPIEKVKPGERSSPSTRHRQDQGPGRRRHPRQPHGHHDRHGRQECSAPDDRPPPLLELRPVGMSQRRRPQSRRKAVDVDWYVPGPVDCPVLRRLQGHARPHHRLGPHVLCSRRQHPGTCTQHERVWAARLGRELSPVRKEVGKACPRLRSGPC